METGHGGEERIGFFTRVWQQRVKAPLSQFKSNVAQLPKKVKKIAQDDPRRVIHSLKVGLALTLVSLFYYFRPLYNGFGVSTMWAVLTVVVVFEYTVGATLGKGLNRTFATSLAGALAVGAHHLASLTGEKGEPILLGASVFLLAAAATFARFFPGIKARYDYGVVIFILTFSLVAVSGYRVDEIIELAHQRLSTIIIGGFTCVLIAIFVCPVWAGEDLQNLIAQNIEKLSCFLEGFGSEYFKEEEGETGDVSKEDKTCLQSYKSVLNTKASEEALANFARWEPSHGRFLFHHPWNLYLKIGSLARQCAYSIESLNAFVGSGTKAPKEFQQKIKAACTKMSSETGKALLELSSSMRTMTQPTSATEHVAKAKTAAANLKNSLKTDLLEIDLLEIVPAVNVASLLMEIVAQTEEIKEAIDELARVAKFKNPTFVTDRTPSLSRAAIKPLSDNMDGPHVVIDISGSTTSDSPENAKVSHEITRIRNVDA
ncbi:aluminum-activated malate transporter 8 [Magnolia sinica]|uniref:aluminum-activated malate transporter 8 n=1 Tax=Magnolia sinica TaxID=86752 RepID=UPI002658008D|nr:aluminum-activated malate transporter 8 [Magnolia sinica]